MVVSSTCVDKICFDGSFMSLSLGFSHCPCSSFFHWNNDHSLFLGSHFAGWAI